MVNIKDRTGGSKILGIIIILVLVLSGYCVWKVIDTRVKNYDFEEGILDVVKYGSGKKDAVLLSEVMAEAKKAEVDMFVRPEHITISKKGGKMNIKADYVYIVQFPLYEYRWEVHIDKDSPEF
ncbi:hypothetical protein ACFLU6_15385 [Acidobacteriota bacterium]